MFEDFDKRAKKMDDDFNASVKGMRKFALIAIILNLIIGLGFVAGVCWIVKYFFFGGA